MIIDEYLSQIRTAKRRSDELYNKLTIAQERALNVRSPGNVGDGTPYTRTNENAAETRLLNYIDIGKEYDTATKTYIDTRKQVINAIDYLLYWQGCLIYQVYIYNVVIEADDDLSGADDILHTNNRREILAKLAEAKEALADLLREQGIEIE